MVRDLRPPSWREVDQITKRASQDWSADNSHVDNEAAYCDRKTLTEAVAWLRQELADTQDALAEADREIATMTAWERSLP